MEKKKAFDIAIVTACISFFLGFFFAARIIQGDEYARGINDGYNMFINRK